MQTTRYRRRAHTLDVIQVPHATDDQLPLIAEIADWCGALGSTLPDGETTAIRVRTPLGVRTAVAGAYIATNPDHPGADFEVFGQREIEELYEPAPPDPRPLLEELDVWLSSPTVDHRVAEIVGLIDGTATVTLREGIRIVQHHHAATAPVALNQAVARVLAQPIAAPVAADDDWPTDIIVCRPLADRDDLEVVNWPPPADTTNYRRYRLSTAGASGEDVVR